MNTQRQARASLALLFVLATLLGVACTPSGGGSSVPPPAASTAPAAPSVSAPSVAPGASGAGKGSY